MHNPRFRMVVALIALAAAARLLPHPPNIVPIAAMSLFAGSYLRDWRLALAVPLTAMLLTDTVIGFHVTMPFVYAGMAATVMFGMWTARRRTVAIIAGAALASSTLFFVLTNFGVWATQGLYPHTGSGLLACYIAALPFFHQSLAGDLTYTLVLFGAMRLLERGAVRTQPAAAD